MYWYAVTRLPIVGNQGELEPWSAAFISWLAKSAGLTPEDFPRTVLHWDYIERALQARDGARFAAHDPRAYAPKVGDLVCVSRSNAVAGFAELRRGPYHCDLVVGVEAGEIDAIGGNVGDAVSLARYEVDERGLLMQRDDQPWVVVIEQRDPYRGPSEQRRLSGADTQEGPLSGNATGGDRPQPVRTPLPRKRPCTGNSRPVPFSSGPVALTCSADV